MEWKKPNNIERESWRVSEDGQIVGGIKGPLYSSTGIWSAWAIGRRALGDFVTEEDAMNAVEEAASAKMSEPQRCGGCRFYMQQRQVSAGEAEWGDCRRNAPRVCREDNAGGFPWVYSSNWCGEWEPKP